MGPTTGSFPQLPAALENPLNLILLLVAVLLIRSLIPSPSNLPEELPSTPVAYAWRPSTHPESKVWRSWTPRELTRYDGTPTGAENGRILFAIRRKVYDVSSGRGFYGPGGPYENFAGRDASRGLAKQSFDEDMLTPVDQPIDSLGDLSQAEWANLSDWEETFKSKYILCGDLVETPVGSA